MHAIAHTLGALYNAHHGLLNAILMPYVLDANRSEVEQKMERLARYLDLDGSGTDAVLAWILTLRREVGIPHTLADIGITAEEAERVGKMAVNDPSAGGNPISFTAEQYSQLFTLAVNGKDWS